MRLNSATGTQRLPEALFYRTFQPSWFCRTIAPGDRGAIFGDTRGSERGRDRNAIPDGAAPRTSIPCPGAFCSSLKTHPGPLEPGQRRAGPRRVTPQLPVRGVGFHGRQEPAQLPGTPTVAEYADDPLRPGEHPPERDSAVVECVWLVRKRRAMRQARNRSVMSAIAAFTGPAFEPSPGRTRRARAGSACPATPPRAAYPRGPPASVCAGVAS